MTIEYKSNLEREWKNEIYKREIERGREWRLGFFKWFGYVSLRPQDVANGLHLY